MFKVKIEKNVYSKKKKRKKKGMLIKGPLNF